MCWETGSASGSAIGSGLDILYNLPLLVMDMNLYKVIEAQNVDKQT